MGKVLLHIRRRHWLNGNGENGMTDFSLIQQSTRCSTELALFMWALVKWYDEVRDFDNKAFDDIANAMYDREDEILNYFVNSAQPMLQPSLSMPKSNTSEFSFTEFWIRSFFSLD